MKSNGVIELMAKHVAKIMSKIGAGENRRHEITENGYRNNGEKQ
jgi:hypothetical protein